ncbi:MAG: immunity 53 family protein [Deltaproteobacteria bacterium]|jgi:hypothetical protein|nr:immunity 53 family protein [Deltaproteobacteria bacterium]
MNILSKLQDWYFSQCDEDWEHEFGVTIDTLDNPGWRVIIYLTNTNLESSVFAPIEYGLGVNSEPDGNNWLVCKVEDNQFKGHGGPFKLEEIIEIFLDWADENN